MDYAIFFRVKKLFSIFVLTQSAFALQTTEVSKYSGYFDTIFTYYFFYLALYSSKPNICTNNVQQRTAVRLIAS